MKRKNLSNSISDDSRLQSNLILRRADGEAPDSDNAAVVWMCDPSHLRPRYSTPRQRVHWDYSTENVRRPIRKMIIEDSLRSVLAHTTEQVTAVMGDEVLTADLGEPHRFVTTAIFQIRL